MVRKRRYRKKKHIIDNDDDDYSSGTELEIDKADNVHQMDNKQLEESLSSAPRTPKPDPVPSKTSIKSTPVCRKRRQRSINRTMNVTNLNILFDSSYINQGSTPHRPNDSTTFVNRTPSSKLGESREDITETPKVSQFGLIDDFVQHLKSPFEGHNSNINQYKVNINPYINNPDLKYACKDNSVGEMSFFTPHLYNLKSSSTPIDKIQSHNNQINNILKQSPIKSSPKNVNYPVNSIKIDKSINFMQSTPFIDNNNLNKTNNNNNNNIKSFRNISRISKTNSSNILLDPERRNSLETIFTRLKKYSRSSVQWTHKLIDFCNYIGVNLKKTFSGIGNPLETNCKCDEYKIELNQLNNKVEELRTDLFNTKIELERYKQNEYKLNNELLSIKQELTQFNDIKSEINRIRSDLALKNTTNTTIIANSMGGQPPPPPPPPPPLFLIQKNTLNIPKKDKLNNNNNNNKENSRPIISLDDILKVKLKKTTDRPKTLRRSTEPTISTEMLKQVKLKPASRPQTPILSADDLLSTSPCSSLTRILNDNVVCKVKRLKRVSGYSFDDVSRRSSNQMQQWGRLREREREKTTYN